MPSIDRCFISDKVRNTFKVQYWQALKVKIFIQVNLAGGVKLWYNYTILVNKNTGASAALLLRFLIQIARGTKCLIELK